MQDFERVVFKSFISDKPLAGLKRRQKALKGLAKVPRSQIPVRYVAGMDVAYEGEHAFSAAVLFDHVTGKIASFLVDLARVDPDDLYAD